MPAYTTPGVYVNETALTSLAASTSGITAAAFFGEAERGPTTPVLVQDWASFKTLYGDLNTLYDLGYAVFHFFNNGGRSCYVTRVVGEEADVSTYAALPFYPEGNASASAGMLDIDAISAGTWGNSLQVQTLTGVQPASATSFGTFTLVVTLDGAEVERWPELSIDPNANRYVETVINNYSRFIRVSNINVGEDVYNADLDYYTTAVTLAAGADDDVIDTDYTTALDLIDGIEGNLILNAVGKTSSTIVSAFIAKAASRGDSFVIVDPDASDTSLSEIQATAANFSGLSNGGYAAHYAPMLKMIDPAKTGPAAIRNTYPGGALAGLYVRTDVEQTVAQTPAGFQADIRGALGLAVPLSHTQIGTLYDGSPQVNSFKAIPGAGIVVWGGRTLQKINPDKFISVRRTLNYLKHSLKELTQFAVFEPNDARLWSQINLTISGFLSDFWRAGGLKGDAAAQAFFIVCDETNNTPTSIDQGEVHVDVGVALTYPAEFIVINLSQWTGGSNAADSL